MVEKSLYFIFVEAVVKAFSVKIYFVASVGGKVVARWGMDWGPEFWKRHDS